MILSNFFWHDILKINTEYYKKIEKKIANRPIIPNYLFCSKYIKKKFKIHPVGFYGSFKEKNFYPKKKGLLISFGTADMKFNKELKNIQLILTQRDNLKNPIYLEPRYYNNKLKKYNIHKADYDDKMYQKVAIAIIKPGLGTITDCLLRGITIVTYTRGQNKEF